MYFQYCYLNRHTLVIVYSRGSLENRGHYYLKINLETYMELLSIFFSLHALEMIYDVRQQKTSGMVNDHHSLRVESLSIFGQLPTFSLKLFLFLMHLALVLSLLFQTIGMLLCFQEGE